MARSSKRRKDKAADFTKAKLKLGKGKQLANNAIDTSFKARSIVLPTQSIAIEKDDSAPLTKRNLSFGDLISHLKHHNSTARKDAVLGLRELLEAHWQLLESNLTSLVKALVRLIGDEDAGVRKTLLLFFGWLLPRIPSEDVIPHAPMLLLFTTSAQTHIFPEIRIDAVRFLDIFLDRIPQIVTSGFCEGTQSHGSRVLEGYLGILNAGTRYGESEGPAVATSSASVILTPPSKLVVMNSLSTFLHYALTPTDLPSDLSTERGFVDPTKVAGAWYLRNAFLTNEAFQEFEQLLRPQYYIDRQNVVQHRWQASEGHDFDLDKISRTFPLAASPSGQHWTLQDLGNFVEGSSTAGPSGFSSKPPVAFIGHLAQTLHSTLVANFLDCAPSVFSPAAAPSETEVDLVVVIARIVHCLYKVLLQEPEMVPEVRREALKSILGYMTPYFPAYSTGSKMGKFERSFEEYNLIFCELTSLVVITSQPETSHSFRKKKAQESLSSATSLKRNGHDLLSKQTASVSDYIVQRLQGRASSSGIASMIGPSAYLTLLPTVWALVNNMIQGEEEKANSVLIATIEHALKMSSKAAGKRLTIEFMSRLILLNTHPQYRGAFRIGRNPAEDQKFEAWLLHLPQVLWELGNSNLMATETILRALLRILQRRSRLVHAETVSQLQGRLAPYFDINHAVRGHLPGPFCKLPAGLPVRRLALDVMTTLHSRGKPDSTNGGLLSSAVCLAVQGTEEEKYWSHVGINFSQSRHKTRTRETWEGLVPKSVT